MKYVIIGTLSLISISSAASDIRYDVFEAKEKKLVIDCLDNKNNTACEELVEYYSKNNEVAQTLIVADHICLQGKYKNLSDQAPYCHIAGHIYLHEKNNAYQAAVRLSSGCAEIKKPLNNNQFLTYATDCLIASAYSNNPKAYNSLSKELGKRCNNANCAKDMAWAQATWGDTSAAIDNIEASIRYGLRDKKAIPLFKQFKEIRTNSRYENLLEKYED